MMRGIKQWYTRNSGVSFVIITCLMATIIGIFLIPNEIRQDAWLIESFADGTFGANNRNLVVLGAHSLMSALIFVLSLTGLRLMWFNLILVFSIIGSHFIISMVLYSIGNSRWKKMLVILHLLFATSMLWNLDFTVVASYTIAAGGVLLFYYLEFHSSKWTCFIGLFWVIWGYLIRIDCIYFSLAVFGLLGLYYLIDQKIRNKGDKKNFSLKAKSFFSVFGFMLGCLLFLQVTQIFLFHYVDGDFVKWNEMRSTLDDYELPDYNKYKDEYKEIGISYNDYQLLKLWDYQDPEYFTEERMQQLVELKNQVNQEAIKKNGIIWYAKQAVGELADFSVYEYLAILFLFAIIFLKKNDIIFGIILFGCVHLLAFYFCIRGRLIDRIAISLLLTLLIAFQYFFMVRKKVDDISLKKKEYWVVTIICLFVAVFFKPPKAEASLYQSIKGQLNIQWDLQELKKKESTTIDYNVSQRMSENKEILYFQLFYSPWLQQYPLNIRAPFLTAPVNSSSNFGCLGQYPVKLGVNEKILEEYGVQNPFRDLIHDNIRIECEVGEVNRRVEVIQRYLEEHYYDNVDYCIESIWGNCAIIRFLQNWEINAQYVGTPFQIKVRKNSIEGIKSIDILFSEQNVKWQEWEDVYLQVENTKGEKFMYGLFHDEDNQKLRFMLPEDSLKLGRLYKVSLFYKNYGQWYQMGDSDFKPVDKVLK
ncbi:hypothetical protein [Hominifimenecus sp. rT4P-3]|uniref:hypothetical protein n=1 Tax=Hominifimenecus sp. rT4P-3 TaxID=3242979 RepID=UPI003DA699F7